MTVEPSWLIDAYHWPNTLEKMKAEGALVPDTRLQDIADAWKAIKQADSLGYSSRQEHKVLDSLLDALTEDDNE